MYGQQASSDVELLLLEEDVKALEEIYPQGEKAETAWAKTILGYLAKVILGILGLIVSVAWVAHIVIYLLIDPPLSSFLNEVFIKLDDVWGLLGTAAFAFFCFYLLLAVIAGAMMLGLRLVFITIHPMKWGAMLMNSFLFNVGLILLCSIRGGEEKSPVEGSNFPVKKFDCIAVLSDHIWTYSSLSLMFEALNPGVFCLVLCNVFLREEANGICHLIDYCTGSWVVVTLLLLPLFLLLLF